jgi:hypothetical protein
MRFQVNAERNLYVGLTDWVSGMVGVGGFFIMGGGLLPHTFPQLLGSLSVLLAFVNVSGGFVITKRMLDMFKRRLTFWHLHSVLTYSRTH